MAETEYKIEGIVSRAERHSARILSVDTGETLVSLGEYRNSVDQVRFSPAGDRVLLIESARGLIVDSTTGRIQRHLGETAERGVRVAEFHPGGKHLLTAGPVERIRVWNLETGEYVVRFTGSGDATGLAFSADGRRFAICCPAVCQLWDFESCSLLSTYTDGVKCYPLRAIFDPGGDRLAIVQWNGKAGIYPASAGEFLMVAKHLLARSD